MHKINSWITIYLIPQLRDSRFLEEFIEVWEPEFSDTCQARGSSHHALVVSNLPPVHLPSWQLGSGGNHMPICPKLGWGPERYFSHNCVSIFHLANAMDVRGRQVVDRRKMSGSDVLWHVKCHTGDQLWPPRWQNDCAWHTCTCVIVCILACDMLGLTCTCTHTCVTFAHNQIYGLAWHCIHLFVYLNSLNILSLIHVSHQLCCICEGST